MICCIKQHNPNSTPVVCIDHTCTNCMLSWKTDHGDTDSNSPVSISKIIIKFDLWFPFPTLDMLVLLNPLEANKLLETCYCFQPMQCCIGKWTLDGI